MAAMAAAHILCVDDDPDTCACLSDVLADLGYRVSVAYNGETALQLLDEGGYRLALIDYWMPDMDGVTLYRHVQGRRPELVGVLVTACAVPETVAAATAAGMRRVLGKPVDFGQLLPLVGEVLGGVAE
jgi:DNA-binding NtrC family response regulator